MASPRNKSHPYKLMTSAYKIRHPLLLMPDKQELTEDSYYHLGDEFITFSHEDSAHSIEQFCVRWLVSPERLKSLAKSNDYSYECYKIMLANLLLKRLELVKKGKMPSNVFLATLHEYSPCYSRWITEIKKAGGLGNKDTLINVMMQQMPSSPLVPPLKTKNEVGNGI